MSSAPPPVPAAPSWTPPDPPPPKKTSPWVWVAAGCGVIVLLGVIAVFAGGLFLKRKLDQAGLSQEEMQKNPELAGIRLAVALNPELELVSHDDAKKTVTIRQKSSGKTVTVSFEDVKNGRISFKEEGKDGKTLEIDGSGGGIAVKSDGGTATLGGDAKLPAWIPAYPGATPKANMTSSSAGQESGTFSFSVADPAQKVIDFYKSALQKDGYEVTSNLAQQSGTAAFGSLSAKKGGHNIDVTAAASGAETLVTVIYEGKS